MGKGGAKGKCNGEYGGDIGCFPLRRKPKAREEGNKNEWKNGKKG